MQARTITAGPLSALDANAIVESVTPTAGALTMDGILVTGDIAYMDNPRRVYITCADDEHLNVFTIIGTNWAGDVITEDLAGANATTTYSVLDYLTVTSISIESNAAGAIEIGVNAIGGSGWFRADDFAPGVLAVQCNATGTVNYTVQLTLNDPNDPFNPVDAADMVWISSADTAVVGATASKFSSFNPAPKFVRVLLNSGSGSVATTILQSSNGPI